MTVANADSAVAPVLTAAVLLLAAQHARRLDLPVLSGAQIFEATGAKRSRAYELSEQLARLLPGLLRPVGRPPKAAAQPPAPDIQALSQAALAYVYDHPGCVAGSPARRSYTDELRHFVVQLRTEYPDLQLEQFALALQLPLGTVSGWLTAPTGPSGHLDARTQPNADATTAQGEAQSDSAADAHADGTAKHSSAWLPQLQSILQASLNWKGGFSAFCQHVRQHLHINCGNSLICQLLEVAGVRQPHRRSSANHRLLIFDQAGKSLFSFGGFVFPHLERSQTSDVRVVVFQVLGQ